MKKMEKRLRRDSVKIEWYTSTERISAGCTCSVGSYVDGKDEYVSRNESLSYRRS